MTNFIWAHRLTLTHSRTNPILFSCKVSTMWCVSRTTYSRHRNPILYSCQCCCYYMGNTHTHTHRLTEVDLCTFRGQKNSEWKHTHVFIINWSEFLIIFQLIHLQYSVRRTGGRVQKDNDGTMRQKHPQNPTQNILFVLTVQHTQVVSLNLSDFRMEGGPWTPLRRNRQEIREPPKKRRGKLRKGGL